MCYVFLSFNPFILVKSIKGLKGAEIHYLYELKNAKKKNGKVRVDFYWEYIYSFEK